MLVLVAAACGGGSDQPTLDDAIVTQTVAEPTTTPDDLDQSVKVPILSATVGDLLDRTDLTTTVSDLLDQPVGTVPDVIALTETEAREEVVAAGFVPYLVDTFPPTGGPEVVLETFPRADEVHQLGTHLFIEMDGPLDAVLAVNGERLMGVLNGQQLSMNADATVWVMTLWLEEPLALESEDGDVAVGREVSVFIAAGDVSCESDDSTPLTDLLESGRPASFVLHHDAEDGAADISPIGGRDVLIDCQADL